MPEYGRASGGQIRFISKSGSSRFSGNASYFIETSSCRPTPGRATAARTRRRIPALRRSTRSSTAIFGGPPRRCSRTSCSSSAPRNGSTFSGSTRNVTVPTEAMRRGDFGELLGSNRFFGTPQIIRDPETGQPFAKTSSRRDAVAERGRAHELYPQPTPGFPGHGQCDLQERQPAGSAEGQHPARLPPEQQQPDQVPLSTIELEGHRCVPRDFPFARTEWERPNRTENFNWTSTISDNLINEFNYSHSLDEVFISVYTEAAAQPKPQGRQLPVYIPGRQGNRGQDPDHQHRYLHRGRR